MVYYRLFCEQHWLGRALIQLYQTALVGELLRGHCLLCGAATPWREDFCPACERSLPFTGAGCQRCAAPLTSGVSGAQPCGECQKHPPAFDRTLAAFAYAPPVDRLIQGLKYHRQLHLARTLGRCLADALAAATPSLPPPAERVDVIVPVPLHTGRLRKRGYNQSLELARPLARHFGLPLDYRSLRRTRATPPQAALPVKQRKQNVRGAFAVKGDDLSGVRVALVDDVMTSGHTVNAAAGCLRRAGVKAIEVWVVARA